MVTNSVVENFTVVVTDNQIKGRGQQGSVWESEVGKNLIFSVFVTFKSLSILDKKYLNYAGLDSYKYAGHSLRSGFATSAAESGAEERNIMAMTGHKSTEMVRRYIKEANLFKNNALNKLKF